MNLETKNGWQNFKKHVGNVNFLKTLANYDIKSFDVEKLPKLINFLKVNELNTY